MEFSELNPWDYTFHPPYLLFPYHCTPQNQWLETPESHIFTADIPGVKNEEIEVEVEDSIYLSIRTEAIDEYAEPTRMFNRKFRLPGMIYMDGISAGYQNGVLTITVPRSFTRRSFYIDPGDVPKRVELSAKLLESCNAMYCTVDLYKLPKTSLLLELGRFSFFIFIGSS